MRRDQVVFAFTVCLGACSSVPSVELPQIDSKAAAAEALSLFDENKDGIIAGVELDRVPGLKAALAKTDTDKNGILTEQEIIVRLEKYRNDGLALMPFSCQVMLDGKPLSEADVRLVPEKFLGASIKPGIGHTGKDGVASINVEELKDFTGMNFGMFRVEISKRDASGQETLPARLNSQTIVGLEIAADLPDIEHTVRIEVTSR